MAYRQTEKILVKKAERRKQILLAARKLFSENDYRSTTMNQIVIEAGTSIGNCYFYFTNKESLLSEIVKDIIAEIWDYADIKLTYASTGLRKLAVILFHSLSRVLEHNDIAQLMLTGYSLPSVRKPMLDDFRSRVKKLVEEDPSLFRGGDADLEIFSVLGTFITILERKRSGEIDLDADTLCHFFAKWNLQAIGYTQYQVDDALDTIKKVIDNNS
jgi:AcrR family transcriptional regulator